MSIPSVSLDQLKQAIQIKEQIASLEAQLAGIFSGTVSIPAASTLVPRRRGRPPGKARALAEAPAAPSVASVPTITSRGSVAKRSPEARARMAASQKARWAKYYAANGVASQAASSTAGAQKKKRQYTPEGKAKIVAALKARWAKYRKQKVK